MGFTHLVVVIAEDVSESLALTQLGQFFNSKVWVTGRAALNERELMISLQDVTHERVAEIIEELGYIGVYLGRSEQIGILATRWNEGVKYKNGLTLFESIDPGSDM